jgi:hypothetical protein
MQNDPTISALLQAVSQLGVAVVFVLAWYNERKERQAVQNLLTQTQETHQAEIIKLIEQIITAIRITPSV